jgi:hypothetical protein
MKKTICLLVSTSERKALATLAIVLFATFATAGFSQEFSTPEELLEARANSLTGNCDLECSRTAASMYSQKFLNLNKNSIVKTLSITSDRLNDARILFGTNIKQKELEKMSPHDVFAHQLFHNNQSIPDEYRYSKTEILSKKYISPNEVKIVVRNSGLPTAPKMSEEEIIQLIKEDGKWKLRY